MSTSAIPSFIKVSSSNTARVTSSNEGGEMIRREINTTERVETNRGASQLTGGEATTTAAAYTTTTTSTTTGPNSSAAMYVTGPSISGYTQTNQSFAATSRMNAPNSQMITTSTQGSSGQKYLSSQQQLTASRTYTNRPTVEYARKVSTSDDQGLSGKVISADQYIRNDTGANVAQASITTYQTTGNQDASANHQQQYKSSTVVKSDSRVTTSDVGQQQQLVHQSGGGRVVGHASQASGGWSVTSEVNREYGEQRLVSRTERVDESRSQIISERVEEREILIPKRVIREEIIERTIVIPEKVIREEVVNSAHLYKEKIIERSKPIIVEKVIEVPEVEYVERIVEEPEIIYDEVYVYVPEGEPKVIEQKEIVKIDRPIEKEVVVEVVKQVPYDVKRPKIVDRQRVVEKEVPSPQPRSKPVYVPREIPVVRKVARKLPIPVAVDAEYEYRVPQLRPIYTKQTFAMFIPRFIEVPVPKDMLSDELVALTETQLKQIQTFTTGHPTLCEIETVAAEIHKSNVQKELAVATAQDAVKRAWDNGNLELIKAQ